MSAVVAVELAPGVPLAPLSLRQYEQMVDQGVLGEDDRVELLNGMLVAVSPQGDLHGDIVAAITDWAYDHVDRVQLQIRCQLPVRCLPASTPEPDLVLADRPHGTQGHPTGAALAIEVAVSSAPVDLEIKPSVYARGGVEEYWVVLPEQRTIRMHRRPRDGVYTQVDDATEASFGAAVLRMADLPSVDNTGGTR